MYNFFFFLQKYLNIYTWNEERGVNPIIKNKRKPNINKKKNTTDSLNIVAYWRQWRFKKKKNLSDRKKIENE